MSVADRNKNRLFVASPLSLLDQILLPLFERFLCVLHNLFLQSDVYLRHEKFVEMSPTKWTAQSLLHHLFLANQAKEVLAGRDYRLRTEFVADWTLVVRDSFLFGGLNHYQFKI